MSAMKTARINLRVTERQESVLRRAAETEDSTLSDFVLGSAVEQAEKVLADRRWFDVDPQTYEAFLNALDREPRTEKLAALFSRPSIFEAPFELGD